MNVIKQIVGSGKYGEQTIKMIVKDNERGPQGEKGETGAAATIAAGNAYSTPSGSAPAVINTGTSSNAVFDFYIPKGDKGEKGETGATGARGPQGPQGPQGVQGLQGPQGPAGKNGKDGKDGTDGKDGAIQYTAGANVNISSQNVISATDTTYSDFVGTDGTDAGTAGLVPAPAVTDAGKFLKADGTWDTAGGGSSYTAGDGIDITNSVISATNTGKAKVLTADDYNWPTTGTKTSVALWLLEDGLYSFDNLSIRYTSGTGYTATGMAIVRKATVSSGTGDGLVLYMPTGDPAKLARQIRTDGSGATVATVGPTIANNLTTGFAGFVLDASQGKVLKDLVDSLAFKNAGAPTTATVGTVGQLLEDTTNGKLYICTAIDTSVTPNTYTWSEVGAGGGGSGVIELTSSDYNYPTANPTSVALWLLEPGIYSAVNGVIIYESATNSFASGGTWIVADEGQDTYGIVSMRYGAGSLYYYRVSSPVGTRLSVVKLPDIEQSTGTSTSSVMSQNAVTSMVFADPSTRSKIRIGSNSNALGVYSIAIGRNASGAIAGAAAVSIGDSAAATAAGAIALGVASAAAQQGEMNIGSLSTSYGYNSSNYRLLTGLYDPQSAHDAATKNYVDTVTPTITMQTTDPGEGSALAANNFIAVYNAS